MSQLNRTRVNNVLKRMAEAGVEQMIVTSPISIFYLTGEMVHPGERCLALYLNTDGNVTLVVNQLHNYIKLDGAKVVFFMTPRIRWRFWPKRSSPANWAWIRNGRPASSFI